ncbi:MAG: hypothetical protein Q7L55_03790 [Actinomycetota bacterium]|nr:hypothetical protein [Actinomycetota bacterium]
MRAAEAVTDARPRWNYLAACVEARHVLLTPGPGAEARIASWGVLAGQEAALLCEARWSSLLAMLTQVMRADLVPADDTEWTELGRLLGERGDRFAAWLECTVGDLIGLLDTAHARPGVPA